MLFEKYQNESNQAYIKKLEDFIKGLKEKFQMKVDMDELHLHSVSGMDKTLSENISFNVDQN